MFSPIANKAISSPWIDVHTIPQDLIEGVVATFIGLVILFSIKPRLKIELLPVGRKAKGNESDTGNDQPSETFSFRVTNRRWRKVTEVRVRLLRIPRGGARQKIDLTYDELFELRGRWSPLKPSRGELLSAYLERLTLDESRRQAAQAKIKDRRNRRTADKRIRGHFTFYPKRGELEKESRHLQEHDFVLFQVIARDAFTGSSRLKTVRFYKADLEKVAGQAPSGKQSPAASTQP
jgi:hypothetical protein